MELALTVQGQAGIPQKTKRAMQELLYALLQKTKITNGVFTVRLLEQVKGTTHRQGLAHVDVRHTDVTGVHLRAQPGDNKTSYTMVITPPSDISAEDLRNHLAKAVRNAKMSSGQRKPVAAMEAAFQKMVALCRLMDGQPFSTAAITTEIAEKCGYENARSLISAIRRFKGNGSYVTYNGIQHSFNEDILAEAFPERGADCTHAAMPTAPQQLDTAHDAETKEELPDDETASTVAFLLNGMTPLLQTALHLIAEGDSVHTVTVPDGNGGHPETRLGGGKLGLNEDEYDIVFPVLEIAKILRALPEPGKDGHTVFSVNMALVSAVVKQLKVETMEAPASTTPVSTRESLLALEKALHDIVERRMSLLEAREAQHSKLLDLEESVRYLTEHITKLEAQLRILRRQHAQDTNALDSLKSKLAGGERQDELLAYEEARLRDEHQKLSEGVVRDALAELKERLTPDQLEMLKAQLT